MQSVVITSSGQFTIRERNIMDAVKIKFSLINIVFYVCWIPNLINGILLWILWFHLPVEIIISIWYIMVSNYKELLKKLKKCVCCILSSGIS